MAVLVWLTTTYLLSREPEKIDSIAVLPLITTNTDQNVQVISDGITDSLIDSLSKLPNLRVMSRSSVFHYKGREIDSQAVGRELKVKAVLTGRLVQERDTLVLNTELVNVADDRHLWGEEYERKVSDVLSLQQELARTISAKLIPTLSGGAKEKIAKQRTTNSEAYQFYVRGRTYQDALGGESLKRAVESFQLAVSKDPGYASAYAGMADAYGLLAFFAYLPTNETLRKAEEAANKAIRLDDTNAEAHASLGLVSLFDWKWQVAERELRRAIELNPNLAIAHGYYGIYLSSQGRLDEGLAEDKLELGLDPISQIANANLCGMYYSAREYDQSIQQCLKELQMYPDDPISHYNLASDYEQKKLYEQALEQYQQGVTLQGEAGSAAASGRAYAAKGWKGVLEKDIEVCRQRGTNDYDPFEVAVDYARLGEKDTAFFWLEKAYEGHRIPFFIKTQPQLDKIRSDARYADLLRRMGLPQ